MCPCGHERSRIRYRHSSSFPPHWAGCWVLDGNRERADPIWAPWELMTDTERFTVVLSTAGCPEGSQRKSGRPEEEQSGEQSSGGRGHPAAARQVLGPCCLAAVLPAACWLCGLGQVTQPCCGLVALSVKRGTVVRIK